MNPKELTPAPQNRLRNVNTTKMHHHNLGQSSTQRQACLATTGNHAWSLNVRFYPSKTRCVEEGPKTLHIRIPLREKDLACPVVTAVHAGTSKFFHLTISDYAWYHKLVAQSKAQHN